jgi:hypothetical protein
LDSDAACGGVLWQELGASPEFANARMVKRSLWYTSIDAQLLTQQYDQNGELVYQAYSPTPRGYQEWAVVQSAQVCTTITR